MALALGDRDDLSYGEQQRDLEMDALTSKRDQILAQKLAETKPDDNQPAAAALAAMSDEELQAFLAEGAGKEKEHGAGTADSAGDLDTLLGGGDGLDVDQLLSRATSRDYTPEFRTQRDGAGDRGASGGELGGVPDDPEEAAESRALFVDWTKDYNDENELHVPNRIGFSTAEWGDAKAGFSAGKLKKKERRAGRFNKVDLRKAYEKLQQNGISFVETSESNPVAEAFLGKFVNECDHAGNDQGALLVSTFPNPWKHAIRSRSLPRRGAGAIISAAEADCDRLGVSSMHLYQMQNPGYYAGGSNAVTEGLLNVVGDDHARYVGCVDFGIRKLARLQKRLRAQDEFVATNRFEFSLTNRGALGTIVACKKLGITPLCTNVLDGGLATGRYTSTNPTGGEASKGEGDTGPFATRRLEKLDALFKVQDGLREKVNRGIGDRLRKFTSGQEPKINRDITTTQIAINYVVAKGAVPLVPVNNLKMANELLGCLGWDLSKEQVEELDKACKACGV